MSIIFANDYQEQELMDYLRNQMGGIITTTMIIGEPNFVIQWTGHDSDTGERLFFKQKFAFFEIREARSPLIIAQSFFESWQRFMEERKNEQGG